MISRLDGYQRRHRWLGLPLAVLYKFVEDQGTYQAALLTYYGFLSLFPLLLLLTTALGFALHGNLHLQQEVLHSALGQFPVIGDQIGTNIHSFHGSTFALVVGIAGSLYGALGVAQAAQNALNRIWAVPHYHRPNPLKGRLRGLLLLGLLAAGVMVTTALAALAATSHVFGLDISWAARIGAVVLSMALNASLIVLTFRVLTARALHTAQLWPEALAGAVVWQVLLAASTYSVSHTLRGATATYGMFAIVLGLLTWLYLAATTLILCAQSATVRARGLWPRNLLAPFADDITLTDADKRTYTSYATTESYKPFEHVRVQFDQNTPPQAPTNSPVTPHQGGPCAVPGSPANAPARPPALARACTGVRGGRTGTVEAGPSAQPGRAGPGWATTRAKGNRMIEAADIREWRTQNVVDPGGHRIGSLEAIYVDTSSDQPAMATVRIGLPTRHRLVFVPLAGAIVGPDYVKVAYGKALVKGSPSIGTDDVLPAEDEEAVFHHYDLAYQPGTADERQLARR
jgi:YihY family inner membrane protein